MSSAEERESIREGLVLIDNIVQRAQRRLAEIYNRTVNLHRPFSIPKLRKDIQEIRSMLDSISHKKEALLNGMICDKMQEEKEDEPTTKAI